MSTIPSIYLYNTETRSKELFAPLEPGIVRLYTCGPTVYNFAHIGNFRAYLFEDLLRRTLRYFGFRVIQVMNLTDVDDKTIRGAVAQQISLKEFTQPYIDAFFEDIKTLGIEPADHYPAATDFIPSMVEMVQNLIDKGIAYRGTDGSIYFSIAACPSYGRLSHLDHCSLRAGASQRVNSDEYDKECAADFVLWKSYDPERDGAIYWEAPFGKGRPGWHLECSALAIGMLGETIDIHVGGIDNMFPHHENEIAQSEMATGKRFVNLWMHCEHLIVDSRKMSKSMGNFYTLRDILARGYSGREMRMMLIQTHYKTPLNFTFYGLEGVRAALNRFDALQRRLQQLTALSSEEPLSAQVAVRLSVAQGSFAAALADDLNISSALAALFDLARDLNGFCDEEALSPEGARAALKLLAECDGVLGVLDIHKESSIPQEVLELVAQRQEARESKSWRLADELRNAILEKGYLVEDTTHGPRIAPRASVMGAEYECE